MKANNHIREKAAKAGVKHWQIAAECGVSEQTLVRWLRFPLPPEREKKIVSAIEKLAKEGV